MRAACTQFGDGACGQEGQRRPPRPKGSVVTVPGMCMRESFVPAHATAGEVGGINEQTYDSSRRGFPVGIYPYWSYGVSCDSVPKRLTNKQRENAHAGTYAERHMCSAMYTRVFLQPCENEYTHILSSAFTREFSESICVYVAIAV